MCGTWGEVWLDNEQVSECYGLQAKVSMNKEDISICGKMAKDKKTTSTSMTGSLKMHKVNSRMAKLIGEKMKNGHDPRFVVISNLDDPDAYGAESIVLRNVSFDDLTLADWEVATNGKIEAPFTFTDFELRDSVGA
jgi:hypothetical protein